MSKLLPDADYFVRYFPKPLPPHIHAFVTPNPDSTFSIYLDSSKPEEVQRKALKHELEHIRCGHFDVGVDPVAAEEEAEKRCG